MKPKTYGILFVILLCLSCIGYHQYDIRHDKYYECKRNISEDWYAKRYCNCLYKETDKFTKTQTASMKSYCRYSNLR